MFFKSFTWRTGGFSVARGLFRVRVVRSNGPVDIFVRVWYI
jgi:hypothetical protein